MNAIFISSTFRDMNDERDALCDLHDRFRYTGHVPDHQPSDLSVCDRRNVSRVDHGQFHVLRESQDPRYG